MNKIYITGIVASGKTTLARQLSAEMNIPWYELDAVVHHKTDEGRRKRTADEQVQVIREIDRTGMWIFEGTDRTSYQFLFDMADTVIFLDPPLWKRKLRIFTRYLKQNLGIEKCHYKPDLHMLKMMYEWTSDFERNRASFEEKLSLYSDKLITLSTGGNQTGKRVAYAIRMHEIVGKGTAANGKEAEVAQIVRSGASRDIS